MRNAKLVSALLAGFSFVTCSLSASAQSDPTAGGMPVPGSGYAPASQQGSGGGMAPSPSVGDAGWADAFNTPNATLSPAQTQQTTVRIHAAPKPLEGNTDTNEMHAGVTRAELAILGQHDVSVIVDRSLSMTTCDCPGYNPSQYMWQQSLAGMFGAGGMGGLMNMPPVGLSRWQFVQTQAMALSKQTQDIFPQGITVELFSSQHKEMVFHNVDLRQMPQIFMNNHPWGHTDTTGALEEQLNEYFKRRNDTGGRCKPLAIAIITDGMPDNPRSLRDLIVEATRAMRSPHEITITFLQIGTEREGYELLHDLDQNLMREGAKYDIVSSKPFPEVVRDGLARSLVDAIGSNGKNNGGL